ncbi:hypothetical protein Rs2_35760 [Raphanus sativus]|nr:hypothetical protein Rs2_35760 [Raphanus sativus]
MVHSRSKLNSSHKEMKRSLIIHEIKEANGVGKLCRGVRRMVRDDGRRMHCLSEYCIQLSLSKEASKGETRRYQLQVEKSPDEGAKTGKVTCKVLLKQPIRQESSPNKPKGNRYDGVTEKA